jgi:hypothetical protein
LSLLDRPDYLEKSALTNLVVVGDSLYEMDAGLAF